MSSPARGYSAAQISLHWLIVVLVFFQLVFGESLPSSERIVRNGGTVDATTSFLAQSHVWVGFAILILASIRLGLRLSRRGTLPPAETGWAANAARAVHAAFYALLLATPVTGILNYYFGLPTGGIHELAKPAFIILIAGHAGAALWHQVFRRDGVLTRMIVPVS